MYAALKKLLWKSVAQTSEFAFQREDTWRQTGDFLNQTVTLLTSWGYRREDFADQLIVDLGAGSKFRSKFFSRARIVAIEPLASRFLRSIEWTDLKDAYRVYACEAEKELPELAGQVHFVMCINVLDHVHDHKKVLHNVHRMLRPGCEFLLSVDLHSARETGLRSGLMHPVNLSKAALRADLLETGFTIAREYDGLPLTNVNAYGHGSAYTVISRKLVSP